jgi:hypothetical protein
LSANGAASHTGTLVHHTTNDATSARDGEIRIPPGSIVPGALAAVRSTVDARTSGPALKSRKSAHHAASQDFRKSSREKKEENPEKAGDEDEKRLREDARRSRKSRRKSEGEGKDDAA